MLPLDYQLFLGFPLSPSYQEKLNQVPSHQREVWIQQDPDYLQQIELNLYGCVFVHVGDIEEKG